LNRLKFRFAKFFFYLLLYQSYQINFLNQV